ncbi:MAG: hypothetical protein ACD_77C00474G0006 [uncultured bacterium]|nr:MAG: hypothetical protein ACD_77C00474G0006 [uncultured bacterium]
MIQKEYCISVIMPVYKASGYIGRAVASLIVQTYNNFELILVDDCGGDNSIEIAVEILKNSRLKSHYKIVTNTHNQGVSLSRQKGMHSSSGEFVIHLDSDDYFEPNLLERLVNTAKFSSSDIVICNYFKESSSGNSILVNSVINQSLISIDDKIKYVKEMLRGEKASALWNKLIRRDLFDKADFRFDGNLRDDLSASPILILQAQKVDFVGDALIHYVLYNSNSESVSAGHLKLISNTIVMLEKRFKTLGISMEEEFLTYKAITKRKMILHRGIKGRDLKFALDLFPEVNSAIKAGNNPEKKFQYRTLLKLASGGDTVLFRTYRALITHLLAL